MSQVAFSAVKSKRGLVRVSTVLLPAFWGDCPYESMVFSAGGRDLACLRYKTFTEALEGHNHLVQKWDNLKPKMKPNRVPPPINPLPQVKRP
jgi:hypothetical protein